LPAAPQHDFLQFVTALHELKTEIEKRLPDYFDFQSLRCLAINTPLNLVRAYDAAELMLRIARQDGTASREYQISSPKSNLFSDLCERLGMLYGLSLLPVDDIQELNAIDQVFHARVAALHAHLESSELLDDKDVYRIAGIVPDHAVIDDEEQVNLFEAIRRNQDAIEAASNQRIANLHAILTKKTINRDGFELTYYVSGSKGPPVVILNALGQGLNLWYPLMDKLMRRHCVIIWEPRGIFSPPPPFRLGDQVDDLDAVLQQESVNQCHLVCWCTGPKVAVEFYLRRPAVASSMVFLNSTFSYPKGPQAIQELDSDYGRNHAALCGALDAAPTMAGSVMRALQSISAGAEVNPFEADNKQFATTVLSLISLDLKPHILAPFQNESATLNYARQVLDFLSYDALSKAEQVKVPVLFLGGEFDTVASPAMARAAARFFPTVRYLQAQGATHYCIYDRPELIARVIEGFFSNPAEAYPPCSEVSELA
jgi:pimeloyl-ACP methyl ester carboxylesterase